MVASPLSEQPGVAAADSRSEPGHHETSKAEAGVADANPPVTSIHDDVPLTSAFANLSRWQAMRKFWRLYLTGLSVCIGGMYVGYGLNIIGSLVANEGFIRQFATRDDPVSGERVLDANHIALWSAITIGAQILTQSTSPITADRWGRKMNMWGLMFFLTLSIVLEIVAREVIAMTFSRICSGAAAGFLGTSIMVYMSEISLPQFRGTLLSGFALAMSLGQLLIAVGLKVLNDTNPLQYRNIFYTEFIFFGLFLCPLLYIPESPAWLASKGRHEDAKKSLLRLVGNVEGYDVEREYAVMRYEVEQSIATNESQTRNSWRALFTPPNLKRTITSALPFTFQHFVGMPLIFGYSTLFFQLANLDDPFLGSLIIQLIFLVGMFIGFYTIDRLGRRILIIGGSSLMGIIMFVMGGMGFMQTDSATGAALVALCALWAFTYANSLGPIGWISLVEISTPHLRAKTAAVGTVTQSLIGLVFTYAIPLLLSDQGANWGQKVGLFFGGLAFLYLIPVVLLFPETKDRTYLEIDELFERNIPAWKFHRTQTAYQVGVVEQEEFDGEKATIQHKV